MYTYASNYKFLITGSTSINFTREPFMGEITGRSTELHNERFNKLSALCCEDDKIKDETGGA
jgi:hypothetical protein